MPAEVREKRVYRKSASYGRGNHKKMHGENGVPQVIPSLTSINRNDGKLNLDVTLQLKLIKNAETDIERINGELAGMQPEWTAAKQYLDESQKAFDIVNNKKLAFEKEIQDNNQIITGFSSYIGLKKKKGITGNTLEGDKVDKKKRKGAGVRINWLTTFSEVLEKADRFLTFEQMFQRLMLDKHWVENCGRPEARLWNLKTAVEINTTVHAERFDKPGPRNESRQQYLVLSPNRDKFGLYGWVDPKTGAVLNPKHLKDVLFAGDPHKS